jgi:hypothetical protein
LPEHFLSPLPHLLSQAQVPDPPHTWLAGHDVVGPHFQHLLLSWEQIWYPLPLHLFCPWLQSLLQLTQLPPLQYWFDPQLVDDPHL